MSRARALDVDDLRANLHGGSELLDDGQPWTWRQAARCRGMDPELFHPARGDHDSTLAAKAVCAGCPVRDDCLNDHLGEKIGIWGGTSDRERRALRNARRAAGIRLPRRSSSPFDAADVPSRRLARTREERPKTPTGGTP